MKEELLPGIRDSLIGSAQRSIVTYEQGMERQQMRLARLKAGGALDIRIKVSIGTRWSKYEEDTKTVSDCTGAETLEAAVTQAIRAAMIEFCCANRFRLDNLSMFLKNVDIEVEDAVLSVSQYIGQGECQKIFERLGRDESLYAEVREREKQSQSK